MIKKIYYILPFIIVPLLVLLYVCLSYVFYLVNMTEIFPYMLVAILALASAAIGNLSPTRRIFDYIMTIIMPIAFFCFIFLYGYWLKDDLEIRFNLYKAVDAVSQPVCLISYRVMALTTFLASFKPIRAAEIIKRKNSKKH